MFGSTRNPFIFIILAILLSVFCTTDAQAGGGPENVFLVVNPQSVDSMTVANHYIKLRDIPSRNVFYLDWNPKTGTTYIDTFRDKILMPILKAIGDRGLIGQIDYVVYSTDYPWGIELQADINRFLAEAKKQQKEDSKPVKWPKILTTRGSLTGLTYLYQYVLSKQPVYTGLAANHYMRTMQGNEQTVPTMGFSNRIRFDKEGKPSKANTSPRYLLSVALGITGKDGRRGNTLDEILQYLDRSAKADATSPQGIIYYDDSKDVRSRTRRSLFKPAIEALAELGVQAQTIEKYPPKGAMNIMGLTLGTAQMDLRPWLRGIRPGSICDNLTSFGGVMSAKEGQTPVSHFLRSGMAGASGTVIEPFAIGAKFPSPMIHVHYARGCSLAEAFYQSVHGPYQLLIVGEPLCKPWAKVPTVSVTMKEKDKNEPFQSIRPNQVISGKREIRPLSQHPGKERAHHFEVYLDGHMIGACPFYGKIPLDSEKFGDGYHELRVVAVGPAPIYTKGYTILPIRIDNHGHQITAKATPAKVVKFGAPIRIEAQCPGAKRIKIEHNGRTVAQIDGEKGQTEVDSNKLGKDIVTLQVVGVLGTGPQNRIQAQPITLEVK